MSNPLDRTIVLVTGKGGVGKSTVSAALARRAAADGKRVLLVEIESISRAAPLFGVDSIGPVPREVAPNISLVSLDALSSLRVFATQQLRLETLVNLALRNDTVRNFFLAMPAIKSILFLYHLWRIEVEHGPRGDNRFDVMICDLPTTGFVVGLYGVPNTLRQIFRTGPLATYALGMESMLFDPDRCGLVVVTLAEDLPVNESIELLQTLRERHRVQAAAVVVNAMYPRLIESDEVKLLKQAFTAEQVNGSMHGVLWAASLLANRTDRAERLLPMLHDAFGDRIVELPHLFKRQLPLPAIDELAERLETQLVAV